MNEQELNEAVAEYRAAQKKHGAALRALDRARMKQDKAHAELRDLCPVKICDCVRVAYGKIMVERVIYEGDIVTGEHRWNIAGPLLVPIEGKEGFPRAGGHIGADGKIRWS